MVVGVALLELEVELGVVGSTIPGGKGLAFVHGLRGHLKVFGNCKPSLT